MEYATQDADPKVFEPLRKPINDRAAAFRKRLVDAEPQQLDALLDFAAPRLSPAARPTPRATELRQLYRTAARARRLPHDEAFRLTLARVLVVARRSCTGSRSRGPGAKPGAGDRLGAGQPAELLPLVVAARRRAARRRRGRQAARSRRAGRPDAADAARRARSAGWPPSSPASGCTSTTSTRSTRRASGTFPTFASLRGDDVRGVDSLLHRPVPARRLGARRSSTPTTRS